jgi:TIR domain-containing protein
MHPFRIFLSYTAQDQELLDSVVEVLRDLGFRPCWDKELGPGRLFVDEIKQKIATAHLFVPLLTPASSLRPWVHQETGFALGINVPVLPIAVDTLPDAMLAGTQALVVREDLSDLKDRLQEVDLESIILPSLPRPPVLSSIADLPESRTEMLVAQGSHLVSSIASGRVRQRAIFSSFSIPDAPPTAEVWQHLDREQPRSEYYRRLLRNERQLVERQARDYGCTLIITPLIDPAPVGPLAHRIRIETLIGFLESVDKSLVEIIFTDNFHGNETILGDVLLARALPPRQIGDYQQTFFTSHAPTVLRACREFDEGYLYECRRQQLPLQGSPVGHSCERALDALRTRLWELSRYQN